MRIYLYREVTSTNELLRAKALAGEPEGTVVVAESQTHGRGRYGRSWLSLPGKGLYFSLLLRPNALALQPGLLALAASLAIVRVLDRECGISAQIKWPNDVFIHGAKVAGVLAETSYQEQTLLFVIIGIGLNLCLSDQEMANHGLTASSAHSFCRTELNKDALLAQLLKQIMKEYRGLFRAGQPQRLCARWCKCCLHLRQPVIIHNAHETISGIFAGVDLNGSALIELDTGEVVVARTGEFSLREEVCY